MDREKTSRNSDGPQSAFGYHTDAVIEQFSARQAAGPAAFLIPHLRSGMSLLDVGCGPGTVTQGLGEVVAPAPVVGCDLEAGMIERARALADEAGAGNVSFRTGNILNLPFEDGKFDVVFSSAVTEHLPNPIEAVKELARVAKSGALVAITRTDWTGPLMSPDCPAMERFFELLEAGFRSQGGTMNGGRHIRAYTRQAGLEDVEYFAQHINATDTAMVTALVRDYVQWSEHMPIFRALVGSGVTSEAELTEMRQAMRQWAGHADAFLAITICRIVTRKP